LLPSAKGKASRLFRKKEEGSGEEKRIPCPKNEGTGPKAFMMQEKKVRGSGERERRTIKTSPEMESGRERVGA